MGVRRRIKTVLQENFKESLPIPLQNKFSWLIYYFVNFIIWRRENKPLLKLPPPPSPPFGGNCLNWWYKKIIKACNVIIWCFTVLSAVLVFQPAIPHVFVPIQRVIKHFFVQIWYWSVKNVEIILCHNLYTTLSYDSHLSRYSEKAWNRLKEQNI